MVVGSLEPHLAGRFRYAMPLVRETRLQARPAGAHAARTHKIQCSLRHASMPSLPVLRIHRLRSWSPSSSSSALSACPSPTLFVYPPLPHSISIRHLSYPLAHPLRPSSPSIVTRPVRLSCWPILPVPYSSSVLLVRQACPRWMTAGARCRMPRKTVTKHVPLSGLAKLGCGRPEMPPATFSAEWHQFEVRSQLLWTDAGPARL